MFRLFVILSFCFIFLACESNHLSELEIAKDKWKSQNIKDYKLTQKLNCFCGGILQWELEVVNGEKYRVTYDEPNYDSKVNYADVLDKAQTIEEIFDFIESLNREEIYYLRIEYHEEYGFPEVISIDYIKDAVDDEISYMYFNFIPITIELH